MKSDYVIPEGVSQIELMETKENKDCDDAVSHTVTFDFSGCALSTVINSCCKHEKVRLQQRIRKHYTDFPDGGITVRMVDVLAGRSGLVVTVASVKSASAAWTPEQRAEALEHLREQIAADEAAAE